MSSVPAALWADKIPAVLEQLQGSSGVLGDAQNQAKLRAALRLIDSGKAGGRHSGCELFGLMLEIQGLSPTGTRTVNLVPSRDDPQGINGQECSRGTFTSVLLVAPDLAGSAEELDRVEHALTQAHRRAVG